MVELVDTRDLKSAVCIDTPKPDSLRESSAFEILIFDFLSYPSWASLLILNSG